MPTIFICYIVTMMISVIFVREQVRSTVYLNLQRLYEDWFVTIPASAIIYAIKRYASGIPCVYYVFVAAIG